MSKDKISRTAELRETSKNRQEKREAKSKKQLLRRAARGDVSIKTKKHPEGGLFIVSAKGASKKLIRGMLNLGMVRLNGNEIVPVKGDSK
ncbi:MAG: hypothetical protein H8D97_01805 [Proteobacteria bacterium]|nr:hypothetical protein [Pseudomonadota bacterium]